MVYFKKVSKNGTRLFIPAATLCLAALLCSCSRSSPTSSRGPGAALPAPVTVATVTQTNVPFQVRGIGHVSAFSTVAIMSQVDGQLAKIHFHQGDDIKEGQLIFEIDTATYEANVREAEATFAKDNALKMKADADVRRSTELFEKKIESADVHEQTLANSESLKAAVLADEAALQNAKLQLSYCYIRSPITGRAGRLLVNIGNIAKKQETILLVVNQLQPIFVDFPVPESNLPDIRKHMAAGKLKVEAAAPREDHVSIGELLLINNMVDTNTGNISLRAAFSNQDEALWPGQFVNATMTLASQHKIVVPAPAVQNSQNGQVVFVAKTNMTVEERSVTTGSRFGGDIAVDSGLLPGESVVITGQLRLTNGSKINVLKSGTDLARQPTPPAP